MTRNLELVESGLPAESFVIDRDVGSKQIHRPLRFRPTSPWNRNRDAGERLSWRGRNFVEAFAELNRCEILRATMIDVQPGQTKVVWDECRRGNLSEHHYHFICQTGEGAHLRVGEGCVPAVIGELWRVDTRFHPIMLRAGVRPSLHLAFALRCL